MAFTPRVIETTFQLGQGSFPDGSTSTTVQGLRTSARISKAGALDMTAHLRIYGMPLSLMNSLSTMGQQVSLLPRNSVTIEAGDALSGVGVVFIGTVMMAFIDFQGIPEVALDVTAQQTGIGSVQQAKPQSYSGSTDVAGIMQGLASTMGLTFENNDVNVKIPAPYLYGAPWVQARQAADAAGINVCIDNGKLAIWPKRGARGSTVPVISPETGMINYPTYTGFGLIVRSLFSKDFVFGGNVQVQSSLQPANKTWYVYQIDHDLESLVHRGQWFSTLSLTDNAAPQPALPPA